MMFQLCRRDLFTDARWLVSWLPAAQLRARTGLRNLGFRSQLGAEVFTHSLNPFPWFNGHYVKTIGTMWRCNGRARN